MALKEHITIFSKAILENNTTKLNNNTNTKNIANLNVLSNANKNIDIVLSDITILAQIQDFAMKIHNTIQTLKDNDQNNIIFNTILVDHVFNKLFVLFNGDIDGMHLNVFCKFANKTSVNSIQLKIHTVLDKGEGKQNTDIIYVDIYDFYNSFIKHISAIILYINKLIKQNQEQNG